ncbi:MAG: 16S rRNA (uracil(1498)-N(3))-methyltransferase [Ruminococcaceae bacterium]|nr:16S rRNA (uracil(1498)-N(3))-methyltransferase [Oscillospiraceae bacterium]
MYNFFVEDSAKLDSGYKIIGSDYNHIANVLRMKIGERILVSNGGKSDLCEIIGIDNNMVEVKILEENYNNAELPIDIILFQGLPKSDKMELIIQKTVELGVSKIYSVEMKRCVVKLDDKKKNSKISRWQSICESAAKQSKRNHIPEICPVISYKEALNIAKGLDLVLVPYENENGMKSTETTLSKIKSGMKIGVFIGSEGGFDQSEIDSAKDINAQIISLGKRILRTETAAITSLSMLMLYCEIKMGGSETL